MAGPRYLLFLSVCLLSILALPSVAAESDEAHCLLAVRSWSEAELLALASLPPIPLLDRLKVRHLLFFLHIPRTGGRTFHQCFLKHLFGSDQRCPRSYDKLRIDRSQPGCRLISTHDDYSLLEKLTHETTSVVTSLRKPVDRVLSSYEFSIEVAARSLRLPRKKAGTVFSRSRPPLPKGSKLMSTLDIWPWKYLVPTMQEDMFARRDARLSVAPSTGLVVMDTNVSKLSVNDSYDAAALAMPFREFIHHPLAHEVVHNGATFQVAGLTNTSFSQDAGEIRNCVVRFHHLGRHVLEVAKKRLDDMLYVGLTEHQKDSALFFAKVIGWQVSRENLLRSMRRQNGNKTPGSPPEVPRVPKVPFNFTNFDNVEEEDVVEEIMQSYEECVADLRRGQESRRSLSLDMIPPIKFSWARRAFIPDDVMEEVGRLNKLDVELYSYAQKIFAQQQEFLEQGDFHFNVESESLSSSLNSEMDFLSENRDGFEYLLESLLQSLNIVALGLGMPLAWIIYLVRKKYQIARMKEI